MPSVAPDDYDTPWKTALTRYFPDFLAFYFPAAHAAVDWAQPHVFLDQELAQVAPAALLGRRVADKLVRLHTRQGGQAWVLVHVEVQAQRDGSLAERVFSCNYRVYDRYRRPVASLVVLADGAASWRPTQFGYGLLGSDMRLHFAVAKVLDFAPQMAALLVSSNPFALVTAAHLLTRSTKGAPKERLAAKWRLVRLLYQRRWEKRRIIDLFNVLDWLMRLPQELEDQLWQDLGDFERRHAMPWISSVERIGLRRGMEKGLEKGLATGRRLGAAALLQRQLDKRFGPLPAQAAARLEGASADQLAAWGEALLDAASLDDIFRAA